MKYVSDNILKKIARSWQTSMMNTQKYGIETGLQQAGYCVGAIDVLSEVYNISKDEITRGVISYAHRNGMLIELFPSVDKFPTIKES